jgi:hypothetical protein
MDEEERRYICVITYTYDIITHTRIVPNCVREFNELSDITVIQ